MVVEIQSVEVREHKKTNEVAPTHTRRLERVNMCVPIGFASSALQV